MTVGAPHDMDDVVMRETEDSTFSTNPKLLRSDDKHLDVHVDMNHVLPRTDRCTGILVVTLNRKLDSVAHSQYAAGRDHSALEKEWRKSFKDTYEFSVANFEAYTIDGIVRVTSEQMPSSGCQPEHQL